MVLFVLKVGSQDSHIVKSSQRPLSGCVVFDRTVQSTKQQSSLNNRQSIPVWPNGAILHSGPHGPIFRSHSRHLAVNGNLFSRNGNPAGLAWADR